MYLDDILIFSAILEEHCTVIHEVLKHLQEHNLYLQSKKYEFECTEVEYLEIIIQEGEVAMDPIKVKVIIN